MSKKLCAMILTCEKYPDREAAIRETWAKDFDDFFFISSVPGDKKADFFSSDKYEDCKYKLKNAYTWAAIKCPMQYDWLYVGDDDSFANADRIRGYVEHQSDSEVKMHGCLIRMCSQYPNLDYPSGGAGYLCNKVTVAEVARKVNVFDSLIWFDVLIGLSGIPLVHVDAMHWHAPADINKRSTEMTYHYVGPDKMREYHAIIKGK